MDARLIPEVNIGTMGHVDHGKTTLVKALTGKWTAQHSEEMKRGITIKIGYADATIFLCKKCGVYTVKERCMRCFERAEPVRTVSFVDAPGHETLMATVLSAAKLMDGVLFTIAANEKCPQAQTKEHLNVLNIIGIKNIIVVQTKIDVVTKERALESYNEIKRFLKGSIAENAPVIPVSAEHSININELLNAIQECIPTPKREKEKPPRMFVVRSFDINKPGADPRQLSGGILGGSIIQGNISVGDEIEIAPVKIGNKVQVIKTKVVGLQKAGKDVEQAGPGGLVGLLTMLDPSLTKSDSMAGTYAGKELPEMRTKALVEITLFSQTVTGEKIERPIVNETLMLNIGPQRILGKIISSKKQRFEIEFSMPVICEKDERIVISRKIGDRWRLIGYGMVL